MISVSSGSFIASSTFFHCFDAIYTLYLIVALLGTGKLLVSDVTFDSSMTVTMHVPLSTILPGRPVTVIFTVLTFPLSWLASWMAALRLSHKNGAICDVAGC